MTNLEEISKILQDHENRLKALETTRSVAGPKGHTRWYTPGSTIEKVIHLTDSGFFSSPKTIADIIVELKSKDFHFEASDLTLPLRKIVRKGLLSKTKKKTDGATSGKWMYLKV